MQGGPKDGKTKARHRAGGGLEAGRGTQGGRTLQERILVKVAFFNVPYRTQLAIIFHEAQKQEGAKVILVLGQRE